MTHDEILQWLEEQKIGPASVLIIKPNTRIDDINGLRSKVVKVKNIIGIWEE